VSRTDYSRPAPSDPGAAGPAPATRSLAIPAAYAGRRLDQALAELLPEHSRSRLKQWIEAGDVRVDGAPAEPRRKLRGGEQVALTAVPAAPLDDAPEDIPLAILHEDDALLVLDKPAGLVVHPGSGNRAGTLLNALLHHAPSLAGLPRAGIVHRLDKDTSGVMVVARTLQAQTALVAQLAARDVHRQYLAVVSGALVSGGTADAPIDRHPRDRLRMAVREDGRDAVTHFRLRERFHAHTLLECRLETGRTHQIRVHMQHLKHPIVGDSLYGGPLKLPRGASDALVAALRGFRRQALHAERLAFAHPVTGESLAFDADPPRDLLDLLAALREDAHAPTVRTGR